MSNKNKTDLPGGLNKAELDALLDATTTVTGIMTKSPRQLGKTANVVAEMAKNQFKKIKDKKTRKALKEMKSDEAYSLKEGGMVVKDKIVSIDTSPNSGLITTKGFGAGRRT